MKLLLPHAGLFLLNFIATVENWLSLQNRVVRRFSIRTEFIFSFFTMLKRRRAAIWVIVYFFLMLLLKLDLFYSWRQVGYQFCALTFDEFFLASNDETRAVVWDKDGIFQLCWLRLVEVYINVQNFVLGCWRRDFCRRGGFRFLSWWLLVKVILFFWRDHCVRVEVDTCWLLHSARLLDSNQSICLVIASGGDMDAAGRDQALEISDVLLWDMRN